MRALSLLFDLIVILMLMISLLLMTIDSIWAIGTLAIAGLCLAISYVLERI